MTPFTSILDEASEAVLARRQTYGSPQRNFERIAGLWSGYLGRPITTADVAHLMILVKISRLQETPGHRDSLVDVAGYAQCAAELSA